MPDPDAPESTEPTGRAAVANVAATKQPSPAAASNALAFFMGDEPPPGSEERISLNVDFGKKGKPDMRSCVFHPLSAEEFVACATAATVKDPDALAGQRIDPFNNASHIFARACLEPDLGAVLAKRRERGDVGGDGQPIVDTAGVVRDVFRFLPGVVSAVANVIDNHSRMNEDTDELVREIEAGKG